MSTRGCYLNFSMLFSKKTKGYFVEVNENSVLMARTSSPSAPMEVEDFRECAVGDEAAIAENIKHLQPRGRPAGTYMRPWVPIPPAGSCANTPWSSRR